MQKKKISLIITSLEIGGAENMLLSLLRSLDSSKFDIHVITLKSGGRLEKEVKELGVTLESAEMSSPWKTLLGVMKLLRLIKRFKPNMVFCWMYHANLIGGLTARMTGAPVIWSIHHDRLEPTLLKWSTIFIAKLGAWLSNFIPQMIIFGAESSKQEHIRIGYTAKKTVVIPNGFDTKIFRPNTQARQLIRQEFGIPDDALVIGHVGRFDPTKDYKSLILAGEKIIKQENVIFILCGKDINWDNKALVSWINKTGLKERSILLGQYNDIPSIYATLDLFVSTSVSESFPIVIGEAMSCAVPCVVTNVGDSALIVGESGLVVLPGEPEKIADAVLKLLTNKKLRLSYGKAARQRIIEHFSIQSIVKRYEQMFNQVIHSDIKG